MMNMNQLMFAFSSVFETGPNIFARQLGEIPKYFVLRHPRGKPTEHVVHRDAGRTDARPAAALARLNSDDFSIPHNELKVFHKILSILNNCKYCNG